MKLILPEQITEAQYKAYLADWGAERIVPIASGERRRGCAKMQLAFALPIAHAIGLQKALITCADDLKERSEKHDKF